MRTVVVGILEREGLEGGRQVLVSARSSPAWAAGQWEFPGGRVKDGETEAAALVREWREGLGAEVEAGEEVYRTSLETPVGPFTLVALRLRLLADLPRPPEHRAVAWVAPADLSRLRLLPGNVPIARVLLETSAP
ncbi:NUDIX domain-containing protein [Deinococcus sp. YIM 134068]|uniref:NUDIX domain-containing protein n=1 Tax=Deinococcus lichenicola TaxID=3118910 RepID=UPI002F954346